MAKLSNIVHASILWRIRRANEMFENDEFWRDEWARDFSKQLDSHLNRGNSKRSFAAILNTIATTVYDQYANPMEPLATIDLASRGKIKFRIDDFEDLFPPISDHKMQKTKPGRPLNHIRVDAPRGRPVNCYSIEYNVPRLYCLIPIDKAKFKEPEEKILPYTRECEFEKPENERKKVERIKRREKVLSTTDMAKFLCRYFSIIFEIPERKQEKLRSLLQRALNKPYPFQKNFEEAWSEIHNV